MTTTLLALLWTVGLAAQEAKIDESSASVDSSSTKTDDDAAAADGRGTADDRSKVGADTSEVTVTSPMTSGPASGPLSSVPPAQSGDTDDVLCPTAPELKIAVLHGPSAVIPAAALASAFSHYGCVAIFALPVSVPMLGDALPDGAAAVADRVGVDWIITVSPESTRGSVTARLIEVSNLQVLGAEIGGPARVVENVVKRIRADLATAATTGTRITVVADQATLADARALESDLKTVTGVRAIGKARAVDGRGQVVVQFTGSAEELADVVDARVLKNKRKVEVTGVKMRRLEVKLAR